LFTADNERPVMGSRYAKLGQRQSGITPKTDRAFI
jgi:hypothetical protein